MTSFLYLGLRRFHRVFVFRTSKQNIMADPKARTDIKAEMKTEPLDSQDTKSVQDLTIFVQNLLQQMQDKFSIMSDQILVRRNSPSPQLVGTSEKAAGVDMADHTPYVDEMGKRVDELEKNIGDLMKQAEADEPDK